MLSLAPGSPVDATDEELRIFGKICYLLSVKRKKWITASMSTFPHDTFNRPGEVVGRFLSRLEEGSSIPAGIQSSAPDAKRDMARLAGHSDLVEELFRFVPRSEIEEFRSILLPFNASAGEFGMLVSGLPHVLDARALLTVRAVQDYVYSLPSSFQAFAPPGWSGTEAERLRAKYQAIEDATKSEMEGMIAQWRGGEHACLPRDSLFSRLLVNIALNRFLHCEVSMDRHAKDCKRLQIGLLRELVGAGVGSIRQLLSLFEGEEGVDFQAMVHHALRASVSNAGRGIGRAAGARIGEQVDAILNSCHLREFEGESANSMFFRHPNEARAFGWLILSWAFLNNETVANQDPEYNSRNVILMSERSKIHTHGQGMILRRKLISSLLASEQYDVLAIEQLSLHSEFAASIREIMRSVVTEVFRGAGLTTWKAVFDHFDGGRWCEYDQPVEP